MILLKIIKKRVFLLEYIIDIIDVHSWIGCVHERWKLKPRFLVSHLSFDFVIG